MDAVARDLQLNCGGKVYHDEELKREREGGGGGGGGGGRGRGRGGEERRRQRREGNDEAQNEEGRELREGCDIRES